MRLIHPTIYRLGKNTRWNIDQWNLNKSLALSESTIQTILSGYLSNIYNMFIIKCGIIDNVRATVVEVNVVFYKYIQRSRLVKSKRLALLIAAGLFKNKPPLYHVRLAQGFVLPLPVVAYLESSLYNIFNYNVRLNFYNIGQTGDTRSNKLDINTRNSLDYFVRGQQKRLELTKNKQSWPPLESRVETTWINPLTIRDSNLRYKAFTNLAYSLDVIMVMLYASIYSLSSLLADVMIRGLLRNMRKHKAFLTLIEVTLGHLSSFANWPFKPVDWLIAIHGKIGSGVVRSRSQYIKTGYLPLQTISIPIDYTFRVADSKFGSIGVKIWMRRQS